MEQVSEVSEISQQLAGWKAQVDRTRADLKGLAARLEPEAGRLHRREAMAEVEHFQNQFICQKEVADELFHDLKQAARRFPEGKVAETDGRGDALRDRVETFLRLFEALKTDFNHFMDKVS